MMESLTDKDFSTISEIRSLVYPTEPPQLATRFIPTNGSIPCARSNFSLDKFAINKLFLYGGTTEDDDLDDAYVLDLVLMHWTKIDISIKFPLVGHCSISLNRSLDPLKPYIFVFGGWDGSVYSSKGFLINPQTTEVLTCNHDEPLTDSSDGSSRNSHTFSTTSDSSAFRQFPPIDSRRKSLGFTLTPSSSSNLHRDIVKHKTIKMANSPPNSSGTPSKITWFPLIKQQEKKKSEFGVSKATFDEKVPFARRDHSLTLDKKNNRVFLFGGWSSLQWGCDESKFYELWVLNSDWQWTKEKVYGTLPQTRRGHTTVYFELDESLIIYGGCSGQNAILNDLYKYNLHTSSFTKIEPKFHKYWPEGRTWHTATIVDQWIYFYGGLKTNFQPTSEILAMDLTTHQWFPLTYSVEKPIPESNRFGHQTIKIGNSILVFGGSTYYQPSSINKTNNPLLMAPKEKKVSMREIFLFDASDTGKFNVEKLYHEAQKLKVEKPKPVIVTGGDQQKPIKMPPPIPVKFQNPAKLIEEQTNFHLWNPHLFPDDVNKAKIQYFKQKIEEETRKSNFNNNFDQFEGLEDEEAQSPTFSHFK